MRLLPLTMLLALPLHGAIVDATSADSVSLAPGDSLVFQVLSWNFGFNATRAGLDPYPTDVGFTFVTAPVGPPDSFSAWLESPDAAHSAGFAGPLAFTPGVLSSMRFHGAVSTLQGYLHLSPELSASIFGTGSARLVLRNDGASLLLGLPPNTLRQDLSVSLTGGPLSVGAISAAAAVQNGVPEPATLLSGLLVFVLIALARRRRESSDCQPLIHSDTIKMQIGILPLAVR